MSKVSRSLVAAFVLLALLVVLAHGVIIPRFIWESRLQAIQAQYPNERMNIHRVVLSVSLTPHLIISELEVDDPARQENVKVGLIKLGMNGVESVRQGRLQLDSIALRGLNVQSQQQADCSSINLDCLPVLPLTLLARAWQSTQVANPGFFTPEVKLQKLDVEQANFAVSNSQAAQLNGKIEQFKFQLGKTEADSKFSIGWRLGVKAPAVDNQLYISMNGQTEKSKKGEVTLHHLKLDIDGKWNGFPWTGTAEQEHLTLGIQQANQGQGAPFLKLAGKNLRTYIRRDDLPDTHQAAFSVQGFEGGLPAQDWALNNAEWTYTHEDAQAWTFNMSYQAANSLLQIVPQTIAGSEGLPAEQQVREVNCVADEKTIRESRPYWAWQEGWFRVLDKHPESTSSLVLCATKTAKP